MAICLSDFCSAKRLAGSNPAILTNKSPDYYLDGVHGLSNVRTGRGALVYLYKNGGGFSSIELSIIVP